MKKGIRTICYDETLQIEAYRLEGIHQPFPNHFHDCYVLGLIEQGQRYLSCRNQEYQLRQGDLVLFNPGDNHSCAPINEELLDYRALNISQETMENLTQEITGQKELPGFAVNVLRDEELVAYLRPLHRMIFEDYGQEEKEELLLFLLSALLKRYGQPFASCLPECRSEIEAACHFLEQHYTERIDLAQICQAAKLSKSTLLRAFTKAKGVTPYRYLETIRINKARQLLEQGITPLEAALQTGFADQSHFTNYFNQFIGLTPGTYRAIFDNNDTED